MVQYAPTELKTQMLLPDLPAFMTTNDKGEMNQFVKSLGVPLPGEYMASSESDIRAISSQVQYPVVIKARSGSGVNSGVRYANTSGELLAAYDLISNQDSRGAFQFSNPIIQEFVPGMIHDVCSLTINGRPQNLLTQVRQIMYPITGGVGALNTTTDIPELAELATTVLEGINWNGPAQVEFKYDPRDRRFKFIELNPKLWGTLDLSIQAGMNFPQLILNYVTQGKMHTPQYVVGMSYKFRYHQLACAIAQAKSIEYQLPSAPAGPVRHDMNWRDIKPDFWRMVGAYRFILSGGAKNVNDNIDLSQIYNQHHE